MGLFCCIEGVEVEVWWGDLRTVGSELLVYIRFRDCQKVGYPGCIEVACPWNAGDIAYIEFDVVLMVRF